MSISIHADRGLTAFVDGHTQGWIPSPQPGVDRVMLERIGGEVALATSIVRYAANSRFPPHTHGLGEEFLVLAGVFSDAAGDYPTGTYVRNPPGSSHAPSSANGCVIFVKLRQMESDEMETIRDFPDRRRWNDGPAPGITRALLYANTRLGVELIRLAAGATLPARPTPRGEELLLVEGAAEIVSSSALPLTPWAWRRSPDRYQPPILSKGGALFWIKRGHL